MADVKALRQARLEPLWHSATGQVGYRLTVEGCSKALFFKAAELEALRSLIGEVLRDKHDLANN